MSRNNKFIVYYLLAGLFGLIDHVAYAADTSISEGYEKEIISVDLGGGFVYENSETLIGFSTPLSLENGQFSFDLLRVSLGKSKESEPGAQLTTVMDKQVFSHFSGKVKPVFVESDPLGRYVLLGLSGSAGKVLRLDLRNYQISEVLILGGILDLVIGDIDTAYVLFRDESDSKLKVGIWAIGEDSLVTPVIDLGQTEFSSLAIVGDGSLYVIESSPNASASSKRFDYALLQSARLDSRVLTEADADYSLAIPGISAALGRPQFIASFLGSDYGNAEGGPGVAFQAGEDAQSVPSNDIDCKDSECVKGEEGATAGSAGDIVGCEDPSRCSVLETCEDENGSDCGDQGPSDSSPWLWDELYLQTQNSLVHYPSLYDFNSNQSILSLPANGPETISAFNVGWFNDPREWCSPLPRVTAAIADAQSGNNYIVVLRGTATDVDGDNIPDCLAYLSDANGGPVTEENKGGNSSAESLNSPTYGFWNTFLGMVNVLELANGSDVAQNVRVELINLDGTVLGLRNLTLDAYQQKDLVLNDFPGALIDSYGVVRVSFEYGVDGRLSFYQSRDSFLSFDLAFSLPLENASYGSSLAGFNTFDPQGDSLDGRSVVNWLSVANLGPNAARFSVTKFAQNGQEIDTFSIRVPSLGRVDLEGGHLNPGPSKVGVIKIVPENLNVPFIALLTRYGLDNAGLLDFALPVTASSGNVDQLITSNVDESGTEWLEIVNAGKSDTQVQVACSDSEGNDLGSKELNLNGMGQSHLHFQTLLEGKSGSCSVSSGDGAPLLIQNMAYFNVPQGGIAAASVEGSRARNSHSQGFGNSPVSMTGSYNLYLGQENELVLTNLSSEPADVQVGIHRDNEASTTSEISTKNSKLKIPAHGTMRVDLASLGMLPNQYGILTTETSGKMVGEVRRILKGESDEVKFLLSTRLR